MFHNKNSLIGCVKSVYDNGKITYIDRNNNLNIIIIKVRM